MVKFALKRPQLFSLSTYIHFILLMILSAHIHAEQSVNANLDRCLSGRSQSGLLLTQWSASEKANLQSQLGGTAIAVEYSGCSLRLLPQCRLGGHYQWQQTTPGTDVIQINNEIDLYTKLPLGVVSLLGEIKRGNRLWIETTVSGQMQLLGFTAEDVTNSASCRTATHIINNISIGAFTLSSEKNTTYGLGIDTSMVGAGNRTAKSEKLLKSAGTKTQCGDSSQNGPSMECSAPLQVFLTPIPGRAQEDGPPDTVQVQFSAGNTSTIWDVYINNEAVCSTPCNRWVGPNHTVAMRSRGSSFGGNPFAVDAITVRNLNLNSGPMHVTAKSASMFKFVAGINGIVWGSMSLMISAVGLGECYDSLNNISCTGSYSLLGIGLALAGIGTWAMLDSGPKLRVESVFNVQASPVTKKPRYRLGLGFLSVQY